MVYHFHLKGSSSYSCHW